MTIPSKPPASAYQEWEERQAAPPPASPPPSAPDKPEVVDLADTERIRSLLFDLGYDLRRDVRSWKLQWRIRNGSDWGDWFDTTDDFDAETVDALTRNPAYVWTRGRHPSGTPRGVSFSSDQFRHLCLALASARQVDPLIVDYLEHLPRWRGLDLISGLLPHLFTLSPDADPQLVAHAGRAMLIGIVQRAYEPGCELHEAVVLVGDQGCGKGTLVRSLLPPAFKSMNGELDFELDHGRNVEQLNGKAVVEITEMKGAGAAARVERVKSMISRSVDDWRAAYAHHATLRPRRCIFVGTANHHDPLPPDPTGNRRFIVIELQRPHPVGPKQAARIRAYLDQHRDQLFAQALDEYRGGARANLPDELLASAAAEAERHTPSAYDEIQELISALGTGCEFITAPELRSYLIEAGVDAQSLKRGGGAARAVKSAMIRHGWMSKARVRVEGKQVTVWYPPAPGAEGG